MNMIRIRTSFLALKKAIFEHKQNTHAQLLGVVAKDSGIESNSLFSNCFFNTTLYLVKIDLS